MIGREWGDGYKVCTCVGIYVRGYGKSAYMNVEFVCVKGRREQGVWGKIGRDMYMFLHEHVCVCLYVDSYNETCVLSRGGSTLHHFSAIFNS